MDQWNGIVSLEIDPHICGELLFNTETKVIKWENCLQQF